METQSPAILLKATFNPLIRTYLMLYVAFFLLISIIGIPLLIIWVCGVGQWWSGHYFAKLSCEITERSLHFTKGILVTVEKTVPLENIQDVTFVEGPLLKYFNLCILKFETAGQSMGQAHDMELIGITEAKQFRSLILSQREKLSNQKNNISENTNDNATLQEINQTLQKIYELLQQRSKNE
jgi:putative membrane protein